jgi:tryptophanyl-tRNA synthetase
MTQFKEKAGKHKENASVGLYAYPNLMAADILLYKATHVPVGEDQKQHLELTRDIATKFNNDFRTDLLPIPEPLILGEAARVMSLRDGSKKMSKSDPSDLSRINMTDDADTIAKKIRKATSDSDLLPGPEVLDAAGAVTDEARKARAEAFNLLGIHAALAEKTMAETLAEFEGKGFADFKKALAEVAVESLGPIGAEMKRLTDDPAAVDALLRDGADRARALAAPILAEIQDTVGFLRP